MTRRRKLRPDEEALWQTVVRGATPLDSQKKTFSLPAKTGSSERQPSPAPAPAPVPAFRVGAKAGYKETSTALPSSPATRLAHDPVQMDSKAFTKLKRGKLAPEARLDLHGLTLDRAHPRLVQFVLDAHARGLRLVLVITGKGGNDDPYDPAPTRRGVLRRQVPLWLKQAPLSQAVLQVSAAHIRHGGEGAYYVYLRRRR